MHTQTQGAIPALAVARNKAAPTIKRLLLTALLALSLNATYAGSFTSNFTNPNQTGITLSGAGSLPDGSTWAPVLGGGILMLTTNTTPGSESGNLILDDLVGGQAIQSFKATFGLQFGPGSGTPADGMSFNFGPDVNSGTSTSEEGVSGAGDLVVEFDTYDNGAPDNIGIDVKVGGTEIATTKMAFATLVDSQMHPVAIQLNQNGTLNVAWNDQVIYTNLVLTGWAPVNGQFAFGARTGGAWENCILSNLTVTTIVASATPVAPTITAQPQNATVDERSPVTFSVGYDGTAPFTFQWSVNGVADPAGTNSTYTLSRTPYADNGKVHIVVSNASGSKTSSDATLTVNPDKIPPTLLGAHGSQTLTSVAVTFSEAVDPTTGGNKANYAINGLTVSAATVRAIPSDNVVDLTTSAQTLSQTYTITVNNVKDTATTGNTIAASSTVQFTAGALYPGFVQKYFGNITSATPEDLLTDSRYPNTPDYITYEPEAEYPSFAGPWVFPASGNNEAGDNYDNELSGTIVAPVTGTYVFFVCSDDFSAVSNNKGVKRGEKRPLDFDRRAARAEARKPPLCSL